MHCMNKSWHCLVVFVLLLPSSLAGARVLEEVVVTAQKRAQSLQDVGIAVTSFSGESLRSAGVQSQEDLSVLVPNLDYNNNGPAPWYRVRGEGVTVFNDTAETPVGFYIDEVYYGTQALQRLQVYDVDRVEVLRGPQGILFGRNTTAGLIHFVTNKPTDEFEAYLEAGGGAYAHRIVEGAVSGPLTDSMRGRLSFKYNEDDGWQDNIGSGGGDFAVTDVVTIRGQLDIDLNEDLSLLVKASYYENTGTNQIYGYQGTRDATTFGPCNVAQISANECVNFFGVPTIDPDPEEGFSERSKLIDDIEESEIVATFNWTVNEHIAVTSITAYIDYDRHHQEDLDGTDVLAAFGQLTSDFVLEGDQLSQEIRVNANYDRINLTGGFYYYNDEKTSDVTILEFFPPGLPDSVSTVETESLAGFGHLEFALTDQWTVLGGLRYTNDQKEADIATLDFVLSPVTANFNTDDSELTWKVGLNYQPSDDLLLYSSVQTGFKSADFHTSFLFGFIQPPSEPETSISYELGAKWTFLDGRARLNAAFFYNEIESKQFFVIERVGNMLSSTFGNFGDADILGAEVELNVEITERLHAQFGLGLLDTEISAPPNISFSAGPAPTVTTLDGLKTPGVADISISGLIRYDIPTQDFGNFGLQTDFSWKDNHHFSIDSYPLDAEDSFALVNLRLLWESSTGKYHAQAFVENLTDKEYKSFSLSFAGADVHNIMWGRPLWWGLKAGVRFD